MDDVKGINIVWHIYIEIVMKYSSFCSLLTDKRWLDPVGRDGHSKSSDIQFLLQIWLAFGAHKHATHAGCNTVSAFDPRGKRLSLEVWSGVPFPECICHFKYCLSITLCVN